MSVFRRFEQHIKDVLQDHVSKLENNSILDRITVEAPRDPAHGDMSTNAAMVLAKPVGENPRAIAQGLAKGLLAVDGVCDVEVAGPGFINIRLNNAFWQRELCSILAKGERFGGDVAASPRKINVEYVSANPTGPMHVGHCRGAVVGDALANLLQFAGHEVIKEYYVNDAGSQIGVLARSLYHRYLEALGEDVGPLAEGLYPGDYLIKPARKLAQEKGSSLKNMAEEEREPFLRDYAITAMMDLIRSDLALLNIHHDVFFSERDLHGRSGEGSRIDRMLLDMRQKGFVYDGRLPPPKGETPDDWEDREQTLFRSTDVGDDTDRALVKSDGSYTYFAADVAYFKDKFDRGFNRMVYVLGADHSGYAKRLKAVARAVAGESADLDVLFCQLVKLLRDGEPVTMSKRAGSFITLRDVVHEVGSDAVRFMMLYRKPEAPLDFDFAKVTEQSKDNPVFYVQYAHARVCSVFRQAKREMPDLETVQAALENADLSLLEDEGEVGLVRKVSEYPKVIEQAARADEPHRLAFYLYELASDLHQHWSKGKESPELRFINHHNPDLTLARLVLLRVLANVLHSGLSIVGVAAPQEMR